MDNKRNIKYLSDDSKRAIRELPTLLQRVRDEIEWFLEEPNDVEDFSYKTIDRLEYKVNMLKTDLEYMDKLINKEL